ncbi:hypothetical protein MAP00_007245 [Monascus purpureus]|nr:hypothetical protein MAP00_007245 [Monascus purpureus]
MCRYNAAHADHQGPGDSLPTALQIVKDNGIGSNGSNPYLTARDLDKAKTALAGILEPYQIKLIEMDQISLQSIRNTAKTILEKTSRVNILINNAGIMAVPNLELKRDGYELQFAVNHLSYFFCFKS